MKKFFVMAALVGVALTSCMKNEVYVPTCDAPISFEVANYEAQTRAAGTFEGTSFGVNAWSAYTDAEGNTTTYQLMADEVVSKSNDGTKWTTGTPYYWPINGTVDFIAYYPTTENDRPTITYDYDGADTLKYKDYTVGNVDLMYADKAIRYSENVTSYNGFTGVPTLFRHALAKVNFKVQNAYPKETANNAITYEIVVDSITLNKVYNQGTLVLTNNGTTAASRGTWTNTTNDVWTPTSGSTPATLTWTDSTVLTDANPVAYNDKVQYVLPQTLSDDVTVSVIYTVTQKQNGTIISQKQYTPAAIQLKTLGLTSWEMNKNITYTISISAKSNQIFFAPAVEDWVDADGGTITIN